MKFPNKIPLRYQTLLSELTESCKKHYKDRLVSVVIFGSVARNNYQNDSDVDCLLIVENLPHGRMSRMKDFSEIESALKQSLENLEAKKYYTSLSPVFKTPQEAQEFSPLFLDMTEEALILFDQKNFFEKRLTELKKRLTTLGSKRIWKGSRWYWFLKPDFKPGEVFEL